MRRLLILLFVLWACPATAQNWVVQNGGTSTTVQTTVPAVKIQQNGAGLVLALYQNSTPVCTIDISGNLTCIGTITGANVAGGSGGISSINGLTGATQTFVNDTNVTIVSSGTTHTLTWSGTIGASRLAATLVTPGDYGTSTKHSRFTVDQQGRITSASEVTPQLVINSTYFSSLSGANLTSLTAANISAGTAAINISGNATTATTATTATSASTATTANFAATAGTATNATNATTASSAVQASTSVITVDNTLDDAGYLVWATAGSPAALKITTAGQAFFWNPHDQILTVPTVEAALHGNVTGNVNGNLAGYLTSADGSSTFVTNHTAITFRELAVNGTDGVSLIAPSSLAASVTYTLPGTDGSNGQVLKTDGAGALSWTANAASGMSNPLTTTGDVIYSSSGTTAARLGIGSVGQCLLVSGGIPAWGACSGSSAAAGSDTQVQYNNSGSFGASSGLTYGSSTLTSTGSTAGDQVSLATRNTNSGNTASNTLRLRNDDTASGLYLQLNSTTYSGGLASYGYLFNTAAAPLILGTTNVARLTVNANGSLKFNAYTAGMLHTDSAGAVTAVNRPFVDVRDYGALCDNSTDDASAINSAITAAGIGGIVFFPAVTCVIKSDITVSAGVWLMGSGMTQTVLKFTTNNAGIVGSFSAGYYERLKITDMEITTTVNGNTHPAISLTWPAGALVAKQAEILNVQISPPSYVTANQYFVTGIQLTDSSSTLILNTLIYGDTNSLHSNTVGIQLNGKSFARIISTDVDFVDYGISLLDTTESVDIIDCALAAVNIGVYANNSQLEGFTRISNSHMNANIHGIQFQTQAKAQIQDNLIFRMATSGVAFSGILVTGTSDAVRITGNHVLDLSPAQAGTATGIDVNTSDNIVANNILENLDVDINLTGSTYTTVTENRRYTAGHLAFVLANSGGTGIVAANNNP